jgi:hypothetical protein
MSPRVVHFYFPIFGTLFIPIDIMVMIADNTRLNDRRADTGNDPLRLTNDAISPAYGIGPCSK